MADIKPEVKPTEEQQNFAVGTTSDPKNVQELTQYVSLFIYTRVSVFQLD